MKKKIDKYLDFAIGHYVTSWPTSYDNATILKTLEVGDPDDVIGFWEPFEGSDAKYIHERILILATALRKEFPNA